jgi:hypothetical protein
MTASTQMATLDCARPCPVCDHRMDQSRIETKPWAGRPLGERLVFRCGKCGIFQIEWNAIALLSPPGPEIVPK